jgi:Flp pilus assembly pilin Flp
MDHCTSPRRTFPHSNFAGFSVGCGPSLTEKQSWHDRCHKAAHTRSIAVIGRKRSAQDSWDDACASYVLWGVHHLKRRLEKDLIFNPKENTMLKKFLTDETGAELAEYAVAVALLVAIAIIVYKLLGNAINDSNSITGSNIKNAKFP